MPIVHNQFDLQRYNLDEYVIISIFDSIHNNITSQEDNFPFLFAISKSGVTPVNIYISDVKTRYGRRRFGIASRDQIVLFFERIQENNFHFRSDEPRSYVFAGNTIVAGNNQPTAAAARDRNPRNNQNTNNVISRNIRNRGNGNARYRGNAIGNAQNLFIRNILSNLGEESFSRSDWQETLQYFDNKCAYCGESTKLIMEHALPINKSELGEHKLGNLVPSCKDCNSRKHHASYEVFLRNDPDKLQKIKEFMASKNYKPMKEHVNFEAIKEILDFAHSEVGALAERYIFTLDRFNNSTSNT